MSEQAVAPPGADTASSQAPSPGAAAFTPAAPPAPPASPAAPATPAVNPPADPLNPSNVSLGELEISTDDLFNQSQQPASTTTPATPATPVPGAPPAAPAPSAFAPVAQPPVQPAQTPPAPAAPQYPQWLADKNIPDEVKANLSKFATEEDALTGYDQLHRRFSQTQQPAQPAAPTSKDPLKVDVRPDPAVQSQDVIARAGLVEKDLVDHYNEHGKLSDDHVTALHKAGMTDADIAANIQGRVAIAQLRVVEQERVRGEAEQMVGGGEQLGIILNWARDNIKDAEKEALNQQLDSAAWATTLMGLQARYQQAGGSPGVQQESKAASITPASVATSPTGPQPFASLIEQSNAQVDKRYGLDPAYTNQIDERVAVTPLENLQ